MVLIERHRVVAVHLDQLERVTSPDAPSIAEAMYASVALRFLIDDNALGGVAKEHDVAIMVDTPDFGTAPVRQAILFAAGGYPYGGALTRPFYLYREPGLHSPYRPQFEEQVRASPAAPPTASLKLSKFLAAPCLSLNGQVVDRQTLVRYVANKCGGAHYSGSRQRFSDIDNHLTDIGHVLEVRGHKLSAVFLETLGTAWLLLQSGGVIALRKMLTAG